MALAIQDPRKACHVDDRVGVQNVLASLKPALQDAYASVVLVGVAALRIRLVVGRIVDEVTVLTRHRPQVADLPEQPLAHFLLTDPIRWHEPAGSFGQVHQDRARFEYWQRAVGIVVIDDGRHAVVRADRQKLRRELVAFTDVDRKSWR